MGMTKLKTEIYRSKGGTLAEMIAEVGDFYLGMPATVGTGSYPILYKKSEYTKVEVE